MKVTLGVLALATALACAAALAGSARSGRTSQGDDAGSDRVDRLARELQQMRGELAQLRREKAELAKLARAAGAPSSTQPATALAPGVAAPAAPPAMEEPVHADDGYLALVVQTFEREREDPAWDPAPELSAKINDALPAGSAVRSLDCRASMCRLEMSHPDEATHDAFTRLFTLLGGPTPLWSGPSFIHITHRPERAGDGLVAVGYLARTTLPIAAQP